ncbi:MAG: hypothetical protein J5I90_05135 [Caldilineales bacterium]|nr:hypothetical protein [Caldilineales bacterium]
MSLMSCLHRVRVGFFSPGIAQFGHWLQDRRGDLVWSTLVLVTVLIPLGGLSIDVPRYFRLRSTLATGVDAAAAAAAAQCGDIHHFQNSGDVRLMPDCAQSAARDAFAGSVAGLHQPTYRPRLDAIAIDEGADEVSATASGDLTLMFGLTPAFTIEVEARSRYRMIVR